MLHPLGPAANPAPSWLADKAWEEIRRVANMSAFAKFLDGFTKNLAKWKEFYDSVNPELAELPEPWEKELTDFQKLVVMRMIRPDKVIPKVSGLFGVLISWNVLLKLKR